MDSGARDSETTCGIVVVGLGNPGPEYSDTRHNAGAMVLEELVRRLDLKLKSIRSKARAARSGHICLAIPSSYMNESGEPVSRILKHFSASPESLVVVHDDLDLPLGKIRIKAQGGTGGHRGLESIVKRLGTDDFARVRVGIGRPPGQMDPADFVLRRFAKSERDEIALAISDAADAVEAIAGEGIESAMNRYN
ncbi:MAG: aminoacyl-tRNA hydrolase [Acidobacteria bacterium]|nr:MAG: aminoacyl-tRNA hydrolase [Acidobacteriota bacterium]